MPSEVPLSISLKLSKACPLENLHPAQTALTPMEVPSMTLVHSVLAMGDMGQAASLTNGERREKSVKNGQKKKKKKTAASLAALTSCQKKKNCFQKDSKK